MDSDREQIKEELRREIQVLKGLGVHDDDEPIVRAFMKFDTAEEGEGFESHVKRILERRPDLVRGGRPPGGETEEERQARERKEEDLMEMHLGRGAAWKDFQVPEVSEAEKKAKAVVERLMTRKAAEAKEKAEAEALHQRGIVEGVGAVQVERLRRSDPKRLAELQEQGFYLEPEGEAAKA